MSDPILLPFIQFSEDIKEEWILSEALKLNNLLVLPMKILEVVKKEKPKGTFIYHLKVEACADEKEFRNLVHAWIFGIDAMRDRILSKQRV
jgi:hypothetical protein